MNVDVSGLPDARRVDLSGHWRRDVMWPYYHADSEMLQAGPYVRKDVSW